MRHRQGRQRYRRPLPARSPPTTSSSRPTGALISGKMPTSSRVSMTPDRPQRDGDRRGRSLGGRPLPDGLQVGATDAVFPGVPARATPVWAGRASRDRVRGAPPIRCAGDVWWRALREAVAATPRLRSATALDVHPNQAYAAGTDGRWPTRSQRARTAARWASQDRQGAGGRGNERRRPSVKPPSAAAGPGYATAASDGSPPRSPIRAAMRTCLGRPRRTPRYRAAGAELRRAHADQHAITP
jgi:hypothetical protein